MIKTTLTAVALIATLAAPALAKDKAAERTFTRNGQTYVYTTALKADAIVLTGRRYPSGTPFELTVRGNQITGFTDGIPVAFSVPNAQTKLAPTVLASR